MEQVGVQPVNYAANMYVQKGVWVQLLTVLPLLWLKLCSIFLKYKSALKYFLIKKFLDYIY